MSLVDTYEVLIPGGGRAGQALAAGLGGRRAPCGYDRTGHEAGQGRAEPRTNQARASALPQTP